MENSYGFLFRKTLLPKSELNNILRVEEFVSALSEFEAGGNSVSDADIYNILKRLYFPMLKDIQTDGFKEYYKKSYGSAKYREWSYTLRTLGRAVKEFSRVMFDNNWQAEYEEFIRSDIMNDIDYVKRLGQLYDEVLSMRKDENYVVNQPQMDKLTEVFDFFVDIARRSNGEVEPVTLIPKEEQGGITATFIVFDVYGEDIQRFCDVMRHTSAISIDGTKDGICISVTVPEVYVPIQK